MTEVDTELMQNILVSNGHKLLIKSYDCVFGEVDFITKKDDQLWFIGLSKSEESLTKIAVYYIKRYGLKEVKLKIVSL